MKQPPSTSMLRCPPGYGASKPATHEGPSCPINVSHIESVLPNRQSPSHLICADADGQNHTLEALHPDVPHKESVLSIAMCRLP